MAAIVFKNQKLVVTLIAEDNDGDIINLSGRTVHFLTRDPDGNVTIDTSPTIADPTNGEVEHIHVVDELDQAGDWEDKLLIDTVEVPSTKFVIHVYELWER